MITKASAFRMSNESLVYTARDLQSVIEAQKTLRDAPKLAQYREEQRIVVAELRRRKAKYPNDEVLHGHKHRAQYGRCVICGDPVRSDVRRRSR